MANSIIGRDMAVDLGTANTLVYVRGRGHHARRAERGRAQRHHRRGPRRRPRGQADDRAYAGQHHRAAADEGRRDRRLRGDRADAAVLHPAGAPAPLLHQAADGDLRPQRHHRRRAARGQGGRLPGRRPQGLHHRGADGRRDRRRAPGPPGRRQHGRRRRRRHDRGGGDLPRRRGHQPLHPDRRRRPRRRDHRVDEEGVQPHARRAHRRGGEDDARARRSRPTTSPRPRSAAAT